MGKRFWSLVLSSALVAGVFSALPARAQETPPATVPEVVNITDPKGDANYINNQDTGLPIPGDNVGTDAVGTVTDILKVWFTSDATTINVHILTNAPPPASTPVYYRVLVDPGTGTNCLWFQTFFPGNLQGNPDPTNKPGAQLRDTCATALGTQDITSSVAITADGDGVTTITAPRSIYPAFTDGAVLKTPVASARNHFGSGGPASVTAPQVDDTLPGTDFTISSGGAGPAPAPAPSADPAPEPKPKPKPKKCKNGHNGSNSKKCKPKKPKPETPVTPTSSCPAYVPGEEGAEATTSIVTAAATEEKPVEVTIAAPPGIPEVAPGHVFQNIQVDASGAEAGLYVRYEFPVYEDHDIYLNYAGGSEAAHAGGFNPAPVPVVFDGTGAGGHSEQGAEALDGIRTSDCGGYTLDMASFASEGGDMTLKLWLGEPQNDPAAPGGALSFFYGMTGLRNPVASSAQASGTPAATKGCTKGKGKKKGCKKPPVASCAAFTPGEAGTDKPLVTVTDAATEAAPVEQTVTLDMSGGDLDLIGTGALPPSSDIFNIQVDGANPDAGLYVLFEFPERRDYDLNLLHTDGSYAARSRSFNTIYESKDAPIPLSDPGYGGAGTPSSEMLDGIRTADCGGWTLDAQNWLGEGGEFTIKIWLGEAKIDPQAPGTETP